MADPLSVAASVVGLISLGLQTTEYLYNFYTAYRDRDNDLAQTADRLGDLLQSLQILEEIVGTRKWRTDEQSILRKVEQSINRCQDVIRELEDEVQKFKKAPSDTLKKSITTTGRRLAYPFRRSTHQKLAEDVDDFRDDLSIALQALQLKEHQNTRNEIAELQITLKSVQAQNLAADVRHWLKAPDATIDFNIANTKKHPGTGQWFIKDSAYTDWLRRDNSFLWLNGFAGCGKSVLCSTAIQHTFRRQHIEVGNTVALAFFFFTFNDESKQDASAALRALLLQLCGQVHGLETDIASLKDSYNYGTPPVPTLLEHLRSAISRCRHVYILLDALDESPSEKARPEVLSMISAVRQWQLPGLHLLVTSRDNPDIRDHLESMPLSDEMGEVKLKNDGIQDDIFQFVSYQVENDPQLRRWGKQCEKIKTHLAEHANGV